MSWGGPKALYQPHFYKEAYLDYQYERAIHLDAPQMSDIYQVILGNKVVNLRKSYM
jgi:hypothetical protein